MAHTPGITTSNIGRRTRALVLLSAAVVLAHGAFLHGVPRWTGFAVAAPAAELRPFSTRMISAQPLAAPAAPEVETNPSEAPPAKTVSLRPSQTSETEPESAPEPVEQAQEATETIAHTGQPADTTLQLASAAHAVKSAESTSNTNQSSTPPGAAQGALPAPAAPPWRILVPGPTRLKYGLKGEIKGFPYSANGELLWLHDGNKYEARLEISVFLLGTKVQTSKGELTPQGLAPIRFGDKYRSEVAAHFERSKGKVTFSANTPDVPLQPDAQDQVSAFMQLATLVGGDPDRFPQGMKLSFQAVGARYAEQWAFVVGGNEMLDLPGGKVKAMRFTREATAEFDTRGDVWLAPEMDYLPVRIRLTQANGDFLDLLWKSTEKP